MTHLRAFLLRYELQNASKTYITLSKAKKKVIRKKLWSWLHPTYTKVSGMASFSTKPDWKDYRNKINSQLFPVNGSKNPLGLSIRNNAKPRQDHVFSNGAWICETRFVVYRGIKPFEKKAKMDGVEYRARYYVILYDYHAEPV